MRKKYVQLDPDMVKLELGFIMTELIWIKKSLDVFLKVRTILICHPSPESFDK